MQQTNNFKTLDSFCQNSSFLRTKIALITFYNTRFSNRTEKIILILEYLQLVSQAILLQPSLSENPSTDNPFIFKVIIYFLKLVNPSYLISYAQYNLIASIILVILLCFMVSKYILFVYIVGVEAWDFRRYSWLIMIWRWIFKLQGRVLCFFITSFWVRSILSATNEGFGMFGMGSQANIIIASIMLGFEYLFTFIVETQFCYILPTKNFVACKSYDTLMITFFQKAIIQVLNVSLTSETLQNAWAFSVVNIIISIIRNGRYYTTLPLYNLEALVFNGCLINLASALHISFFFQTLLRASDYNGADINFVIITWILLALLKAGLSMEYLKRQAINLITCRTQDSPELIVQKVNIIKQLRRMETLPGKYTEEYDWAHLLSKAVSTTFKSLFANETKSSDGQQKSAEKDDNEYLLQILESLPPKIQNSSLVKLYIAFICSKDSHLYAKTIKIAAELRQTKWSTSYLTSSLLLYKVQNAILANYSSGDTNLDLYTYIKSRTFVNELRKEMLQQTELKMVICNNIIEEISDIGEVFDCAQLIAKSKARIRKNDQHFLYIPMSFLEPLRLYAEYSLMLNYNIEDYLKYNELYLQRYSKYAKFFRDGSLTKENLYQSNNAFLILLGQKFDNGKIMYSTRSIQNICGGDKSLYVGSHISRIFPPSLQSYYTDLFREMLETEKRDIINRKVPAYLYHKDKHLVEVEFYVRIHPYITENLYLDMLIRPAPSGKEFMIIKEDGEIEGATKTILKNLGINFAVRSSTGAPVSINIKQISEELDKVNKAFNLVQKTKLAPESERRIMYLTKSTQSSFSEASVPTSYTKMMELFNIYCSGGKIIELKPIKSNSDLAQENYVYNCNVTILSSVPSIVKLFTFEETDKRRDIDAETGILSRFKPNQPIITENMAEENQEDKDCEKPNKSIFGSENIVSPEKEESVEIEVVPDGRKETYLNTVNTDANLLPSPTHRQSSARPLINMYLNSLVPSENLLSQTPRSLATVKEFPSGSRNNNVTRRKREKNTHLSDGESSDRTEEKTFNRAFQKGLNIKSYPGSFNVLCILFYGVISFTLAGQIILKSVTDNTMQDLVVKKNMLKYAQTRTYKTLAVQIVAKGLYLQIEENFNETDVGEIGMNLTQTIQLLNNHAVALKKAHTQIIEGLDTLEASIKDQLFMSDIPVVGSYYNSEDPNVKYVNNFQVIEDIITAVKMADTIEQPVSYAGLQIYEFIAQNVLNDFIRKDFAITDLFINSVQQGKQDFQNMTILGLITPILLALMALLLILIIIYEYTVEIKYMSAFIKLNPNGVRDILSNLRDFQRNLENEDNTESKRLSDFLRKLGTAPQEAQRRNAHKKHNDQIIRYTRMRKRYYGYGMMVVFYSAILIGIMIWNFVEAQSSSNVIYKRQNQLEFSNNMGIRVPFYFATYSELFAYNNTRNVSGMRPLDVLKAGAEDIKSITSLIPSTLSEGKGNYDPQIQAYLFDNNGCERFRELEKEYSYCTYLFGLGQPTNLVSMMNEYSTLISEKVQDYINANKTNMTFILDAAYIDVASIIACYDLLATDIPNMADVIDESLTRDVNDAFDQRLMILLIFSFSLVIVALLFWYQILKKLREVNNDFKKVLQVFPPNLIRSSFLLKQFLKKTSNVSTKDL